MAAPKLQETDPLDFDTAISAVLDQHKYVVRAFVVDGDERAIPFVLGTAFIMLDAVKYPAPNALVAIEAIRKAIMARVTPSMAEVAIIRRTAPRATPQMLEELREIKSRPS